MTDGWTSRAARLADRLGRSGALHDPEWDAAVRTVPRHVFVANYVEQDGDLGQRTVESGADGWLDEVYSDRALVTSVSPRRDGPAVFTSATQPGLTMRMLEALHLRKGHHVLEIGTGTGYQTALLCHRLGDPRLASVDIEPALVEEARKRLWRTGYQPTLVAGDGAAGLPGPAPYDRIVATCSVPYVPPAWAEQLRLRGRLLVDLKVTGGAGNLVDLRVQHDGLSGGFLPWWSSLPPMRCDTEPPPAEQPAAEWMRRRTDVPSPNPWRDQRLVWFLAALELPPGVVTGVRLDPDTRRPVASRMQATDGSWAEVTLRRGPDGRREVRGGGTDLWARVEDAHRLWRALDEPGWERFGLTVAGATQFVWFERPAGRHNWPIRPVALPSGPQAQPSAGTRGV